MRNENFSLFIAHLFYREKSQGHFHQTIKTTYGNQPDDFQNVFSPKKAHQSHLFCTFSTNKLYAFILSALTGMPEQT